MIIGEYDEGYERAIRGMERQMDRMIQEIHDLKQENLGLKQTIQDLQNEAMDRYEQDRIYSKTRQD